MRWGWRRKKVVTRWGRNSRNSGERSREGSKLEEDYEEHK
jgi:hypothetical protein